MSYFLNIEKINQIQTLSYLGWSNRAISAEIDVDRDTVSKYRKNFQYPPKVPVTTSSSSEQIPPKTPINTCSFVEQNLPKAPDETVLKYPPSNSHSIKPFIQIIGQRFLKKQTAQMIYQSLKNGTNYNGSYDAIKRYVRKLKQKNPTATER